MNRTYAILISIMLTSVSMHGQTADQHNQEIQSEGGIKSDVTFLNFQKADAPGAVSQLTPGGSLGGMMNIWFKDWIGIQPELNLNFKQTVLGWEVNSGRMLSFGIGASFQLDTRDNPTNPHKGMYLLLRETAYPEILGTAEMTSWSTTFTLCGYQPLWKDGLLAGDLYAQFNSENAPWIMREELGGVVGRMRGYYAGRYIDSNQIAAQIELRQHIASRFGCVAWIGAGTVFPSLKGFRWKNILPNCGIGLRVEFKHNMNMRIDFGFGKETAGLCFGFSEAF